MVKNQNIKIVTPLFLLISTLIVGLIYQINKDNLQDIRSKAEDDPNFCQNSCIGQDRCGPNGPPGDPNYNDSCCEEIKKTGDPFACPWPQRGYCTDDQCASIPEGVSRQRCGGPRHSWCNLCISNNCPGYGSNPSQPTAVPTSVPVVPTEVVLPTSTPIPTEIILPPTNPPLPTQVIQPTTISKPKPAVTYIPIVIPPSTPPTATQTTIPFKLTLPKILPPKEKIDSTVNSWKTAFFKFLSTILP